MSRPKRKATTSRTETREERIERLASALNKVATSRSDTGMDDETIEALRTPCAPGTVPELVVIPSLKTIVPKCSNQAEGLAAIMSSLGIVDKNFYAGALQQLVNATCDGHVVEHTMLNFAVSLVRSIEPRDQLETMLAIQMAAVHISSMKYMRKMNHTETIPQLDIQERVVNKLMRTFTSQMEALRKHRNGGSQKVTVKHVHVYEGGQAVVGNISHGGRPSFKGVTQSHEQESLSLPVSAALHSEFEEDEVPVQGTR